MEPFLRGNRLIKPLSAYGYMPPRNGETNWCHACSQTKPFRKGGRCLECATQQKERSDERLMPDACFRGSPSSYTIGHIIRHWEGKSRRERPPLREGESMLGWFVLPPFQRPAVWTTEQKIKLIESIWLELPIGVYVYNMSPGYNHPSDNWLIDGQQRISAIFDYAADEFPVFGYRWSELGETDKRVFEMSTFPAIQLSMTDEKAMEELYDRLAYGGTPHEPKES